MRSQIARKLCAAIAGATLIGSAAACSSASSGSSASAGSGGATQTVTFLASSTTQVGFEAAIKRFEAVYPNIKVNATYLPITQVQTQLTTQLASGSAPDAFITNPGTGVVGVQKLGQQGYLADLSSEPWAASVSPDAKAMISVGSSVYGYPTSEVLYFTAYNTSIFAQAGLSVPKTFADLVASCATLHAKGITPIALPGDVTSQLGLTVTTMAASSTYAADPTWNTARAAGSTTFAGTAGWQQAVTEFQALKNADCFQSGSQSSAFPDAASLFSTGKAAMLITWSTQLAQITAATPSLKYSVFPVPGATATDTRLMIGTSVTVSVNAKANAATKTFVEFLGQPDQRAAFAASAGDVVPAADASVKLPAQYSALQPYLTAASTVNNPVFVWGGTAFPALGTETQGLLTGQTTPASVLAAVDTAWG